MPEGKGQVKYAVVAVDYFTKWAEVEALATITVARIKTFVWQNIVCHFSIPNTIVTDNGRQFDNAKFKQFCSNLKIHLCFASPAHPQSNGQVEAVNKIIKKTLKPSLTKPRVASQSYSQRFFGPTAPPSIPPQEKHRSLFPLVPKPWRQWRLASPHTEPLLIMQKTMTSS
ncbi:unnamed protein product [Prunus armeniaca]